MNRSRVGILPARQYIETGKMPVPHKMPIPQVRPVANLIRQVRAHLSKMPIPQVRPKAARDCSRPWRRAPTIKIITLLSNAVFGTNSVHVISIKVSVILTVFKISLSYCLPSLLVQVVGLFTPENK
ncbi:hypothetical protein LYNGBM3L_09870 [Moorena producens 3L]|uniref:Uncharacterized protein n=1 Tax=Moorena producens 3L TaxID=489825 RepID=F4XKA3_9CYAN|nr:hypothetical protein LYNGBM3L_09870 [Moorena producens 3L]